MVAHKSMETKSECYQLVGSLCETPDQLKVESQDKQATNNWLDIIKNLTVNKNKLDGSREQQVMKVRNKDNDDDDIRREFSQIYQLQHQLQKLKGQPHNSAETPSISLGGNQDCYEQN